MHRITLTVAAAAAALIATTSCSRTAPPGADVAPIERSAVHGSDEPLSPVAGTVEQEQVDPGSGPLPDTVPTTSQDATPESAAGTRATVQELLDRYDRVLTALVAEPHAAGDQTHPVRREWDLVVPPGSALSLELLARSAARAAQQVVIRAAPGGLAYRHHVVTVGAVDDSTIPFTWCGHSPGIGVHAHTGEVLDDAVAHGRGTGMLRHEGGRWWLETLDELDLTVLAPASPDPCPDEVAAARER